MPNDLMVITTFLSDYRASQARRQQPSTHKILERFLNFWWLQQCYMSSRNEGTEGDTELCRMAPTSVAVLFILFSKHKENNEKLTP
jgi:hypothetical protein